MAKTSYRVCGVLTTFSPASAVFITSQLDSRYFCSSVRGALSLLCERDHLPLPHNLSERGFVSGITFVRMVKTFGPIRSTMITAVVPSLSALGAVIFLGEPLYWNLLLGLALATVGIVFGVRSVTPVPAPAVPTTR